MVHELASALNNLSSGNLSYRITKDMSAEYIGLRTDFNQTAETLDDVIGRVLSTVDNIERQTGDMAVGTDNLSRRTENQAATLEETAAALDSITSSVQTATNQTREVENTIANTTAEVQRSGDIVKRTVAAMQEINEASDKISEINSVIDDISFQTNLLALNAGVEAARAGEFGRGFAVVASEVRSLALKSANSANEIRALIQSSSEKVKIGVELVDAAGVSLEEITELDRVTQQNASMGLKSSEQGKTLQQAASELARLVAQFKPSATAMAGRSQSGTGHSHAVAAFEQDRLAG